MSDQERRSQPLLDPFSAARAFVERPGQASTPLNVEREWFARFTMMLADFSLVQTDGDPLYQGIRCSVGAVAAQRSGVQVIGVRGFRVHAVFANTVTQGLQTPAVPYALAAGGPSIEMGFAPKGAPELAVTAGAAALVGLLGNRLAAGQSLVPPRGLWIPPGVAFCVLGVADNTATDCSLVVSQPPTV